MAGGKTLSKQSNGGLVAPLQDSESGENKARTLTPPANSSGLFEVKKHLQSLVYFLNFYTYCAPC